MAEFYNVQSTQELAISGAGAANTAAFSFDGDLRIISDTVVHIAIGNSATATVADFFLPANTEVFLKVPKGGRVSAIKSDSGTPADGTVWVSTIIQSS